MKDKCLIKSAILNKTTLKALLIIAIFIAFFQPLCALADEAKDLFKQAEQDLIDLRLDKAIEGFKRFINDYPYDNNLPQALHNLSMAQFYNSQYQDAILTIKTLRDDFPGYNFMAEAYLITAKSYQSLELYEEAKDTYRNIIKQFPNNPLKVEALYGLGYIYYKEQKYEEAINTLTDLITYYPNDPFAGQAKYLLAIIYIETGEIEQAINQLTRFKDSILLNEVHFAIGQIFFEDKDYKEAIKFFREVRSVKELLSQMQKEITVCRRQEKNKQSPAKLIKLRQKILALKDQYRQLESQADISIYAWYHIGLSYYEMSHYYKALVVYEELLKDTPENPLVKEIKHAAILTLLELGKITKAKAEYFKFLNQYGNNPLVDDVRFTIGRYFYEREEYDKALVEYQKALEEFPQGSLAESCQYQIGNCYFYLDNFQQAIIEYQNFLTSWPKSDFIDEVTYLIGFSYFELSNYTKSISIFQKLIDEYSQSVFAKEALYKIGDCHFCQGDFDKALGIYTKITENYPDEDLADFATLQIAATYYFSGNYSKMIDTYQNLISKNPQNAAAAEARYALVWYYAKENKHDLLMEEAAKIVADFPKTGWVAQVRLLTASSYLNMEEYDKAMAEYHLLIKECPQSRLVDEALEGIVLLSLHLKKDVADISMQFKQLMSECAQDEDLMIKISLSLAKALYDNGDHANAYAVTQATVGSAHKTTIPNQYYYMAGEIAFKTGHYQQAWDYLQGLFETQPKGPEAEIWYLCLIKSCLQLNDWSGAQKASKLLIKHWPSSFYANEAYLGLGQASLANNNFKESVDSFKEALKSSQGEKAAQALLGLGECYFKQKEYKQALAFFLRLTILYGQLEKEAAQAYFKSGLAYEELHEYDEAKNSYKELIAQFPDNLYAKEAREKLELME